MGGKKVLFAAAVVIPQGIVPAAVTIHVPFNQPIEIVAGMSQIERHKRVFEIIAVEFTSVVKIITVHRETAGFGHSPVEAPDMFVLIRLAFSIHQHIKVIFVGIDGRFDTVQLFPDKIVQRMTHEHNAVFTHNTIAIPANAASKAGTAIKIPIFKKSAYENFSP